MKLHNGMGQARYLGLARRRIRFSVMYLAYNRFCRIICDKIEPTGLICHQTPMALHPAFKC
jgi:hypothetical protein